MSTYKGHYTVHAVEDPHISEILAGEPSARRRARLLVKYAELGCMLQKMGLTDLSSNMPASRPAGKVVHVDNTEIKSASATLGEEFITNVLADFMSPVSDAPSS
jgi:hypothetical protein